MLRTELWYRSPNWTLRGTIIKHITELKLETQPTEDRSELEVQTHLSQLLAKTKTPTFSVGLK